MKVVALYDAKNRLSELCSTVAETGEPCVISRRGKPIVKLVRVDDPDGADSVWGTVEESRARFGALDADLEIPERSPAQRPDPLDEPGP